MFDTSSSLRVNALNSALRAGVKFEDMDVSIRQDIMTKVITEFMVDIKLALAQLDNDIQMTDVSNKSDIYRELDSVYDSLYRMDFQDYETPALNAVVGNEFGEWLINKAVGKQRMIDFIMRLAGINVTKPINHNYPSLADLMR